MPTPTLAHLPVPAAGRSQALGGECRQLGPGCAECGAGAEGRAGCGAGPCGGSGVPEVWPHLADMPEWEACGGRLHRTYWFPTLRASVLFLRAIAEIAAWAGDRVAVSDRGHRVEVALEPAVAPHDPTRLDTDLARAIDTLYPDFARLRPRITLATDDLARIALRATARTENLPGTRHPAVSRQTGALEDGPTGRTDVGIPTRTDPDPGAAPGHIATPKPAPAHSGRIATRHTTVQPGTACPLPQARPAAAGPAPALPRRTAPTGHRHTARCPRRGPPARGPRPKHSRCPLVPSA